MPNQRYIQLTARVKQEARPNPMKNSRLDLLIIADQIAKQPNDSVPWKVTCDTEGVYSRFERLGVEVFVMNDGLFTYKLPLGEHADAVAINSSLLKSITENGLRMLRRTDLGKLPYEEMLEFDFIGFLEKGLPREPAGFDWLQKHSKEALTHLGRDFYNALQDELAITIGNYNPETGGITASVSPKRKLNLERYA